MKSEKERKRPGRPPADSKAGARKTTSGKRGPGRPRGSGRKGRATDEREPWLDNVYEKAAGDKRITYEELEDLVPDDVLMSTDRLEEVVAGLIRSGIMMTETRAEEPETVEEFLQAG